MCNCECMCVNAWGFLSTADPQSEMVGGGSLTSGDIALDLNAFKSVKIQMPVPRAAVGSVIGRNGETIKRIQAETGARMQFDPGASHAPCRSLD
jgi:hypothetical protein